MNIIRGKQIMPPKVLIYGQDGVGKTKFAADAPSPIIIDVEGGANAYDCDKTPRIRNLSDALAAISWLTNSPHEYRTVALDSIDFLERAIQMEIVNEDGGKRSMAEVAGGFGKGYERAAMRMRQVIEALELLWIRRRVAIVIIGHAKIEKLNDPTIGEQYDRYTLDLHKHIDNEICEWVDDVLFAKFKVFVNKSDGESKTSGGRDRVLLTCETPGAKAKNRRFGMPKEIPLRLDNAWAEYEKYLPLPAQQSAPEPQGMNIAGIVAGGSSKQAAPINEQQADDMRELDEHLGG